jgi:hypothetical protein
LAFALITAKCFGLKQPGLPLAQVSDVRSSIFGKLLSAESVGEGELVVVVLVGV